MIYYIGLGSNEGDRLHNLTTALLHLKRVSRVQKTSPILESAPLLPEGSPEEWYAPYLNAAVALEWNSSPLDLLKELKTIETLCGRTQKERWAPRTIDLDILASDDDTPFLAESLTIPHEQSTKRVFALAPLVHLKPSIRIQNQSVREHFAQLKYPSPYLMGVLNCTPDSFSNRSEETSSLSQFEAFLKSTVPFIDLGAESTRPGAQPVSSHEEIQRLAPVFDFWKKNKELYPWTQISIDTRHPQTAAYALENGASILNDVSHLSNPEMREIAKHYEHVVFMHSLTVPADKTVHVPQNLSVVDELYRWCEQKLETFSDFSLDRLIFDPGIGFNKTPVQSLRLLQNLDRFSQLPVRLLVGHSRKSFMNLWSTRPYSERDTETLGVSLVLNQKPIHILRVHNTDLHQRAFLSQQCITHPL